MIYITQLIYVIAGEENTFYQFEDIAIPVIARYNGKLLLRIRPKEEVIEADIETPYEVHLVSFNTEEDFISFTKDEERKTFLHLKEKSIRSTLLIKGTAI